MHDFASLFFIFSETDSISTASEKLNLPKEQIIEQMNQLEDQLGFSLYYFTSPDAYYLTLKGRALLNVLKSKKEATHKNSRLLIRIDFSKK